MRFEGVWPRKLSRRAPQLAVVRSQVSPNDAPLYFLSFYTRRMRIEVEVDVGVVKGWGTLGVTTEPAQPGGVRCVVRCALLAVGARVRREDGAAACCCEKLVVVVVQMRDRCNVLLGWRRPYLVAFDSSRRALVLQRRADLEVLRPILLQPLRPRASSIANPGAALRLGLVWARPAALPKGGLQALRLCLSAF